MTVPEYGVPDYVRMARHEWDLSDDGHEVIELGVTNDTDTTKRLAPDGAGGVEWSTGGAGSGRPPYSYVVAADDTPAGLQAIADAVCDGTADNVEINAAIAAMVAATEPYSVLILPGTYNIAASVDFTGLVTKGGIWNVFEASGTIWKASANLTTMVKLDPGSGGQIVTCLDLRLGKLDGDSGTRTVTQLVRMARFNDNIFRAEDIYNATGHGVKIDQSGVSDYPCGNNKIDIEIIRNMGGTAFFADGDTGAYGFQGNTVHIGEIIANGAGIAMGDTVNHNSSYNLFVCGPIEHNTNAGIYDWCGGNTFIVANMNTNGDEIRCPTGMTLRSTFYVHIDAGSNGGVDAAVIDQHFVIDGAAYLGITEWVERASPPTTPVSGHGLIYLDTDNKFYSVNDAGTVVELGGGASFATPAIVLGTAAAAGAASTVIRSDSTIVAFDATAPTTQAFGDAAATGSAAVAARRDHVHGMPAAPSSGGATDHEHIVNVVFSGDGSATVWELPAAPVDSSSIAVYVTGSRSIAWSLSGALLTTLTFDAAPASAANNIVIDIVAATA